jgi:excisionase family DNA binding protein
VTGRLSTAREVADLLGVNPETVLRWTRRGDCPAVKLPGGAIRYRPDELDAWLASRSKGKAGDAAEECEQPDTPPATAEDTAAIVRPVSNPGPANGAANEED